MSEQITVPKHYQGPTDIVNGGYLAGLLGERLAGPAEVSLRAPWPVDTAVQLDQMDDHLLVHDNGHRIASARPIASFDLDVPAVPDLGDVIVAENNYRDSSGSPVPNCFVCGVNRAPGEGLRVFAGKVADHHCAASRWTPGPELAGTDGMISDRYIWAALDCPSAWALPDEFGENTLLARMEAETFLPLKAGTACTVLAWQLGDVDGRKATAASALVDGQGAVIAHTRTLWIHVGKVT